MLLDFVPVKHYKTTHKSKQLPQELRGKSAWEIPYKTPLLLKL